jgi:hypothetical protein
MKGTISRLDCAVCGCFGLEWSAPAAIINPARCVAACRARPGKQNRYFWPAGGGLRPGAFFGSTPQLRRQSAARRRAVHGAHDADVVPGSRMFPDFSVIQRTSV